MAENRNLEGELVDLILDSVNLRHKDRSQITRSTTLVGDGLGLDSLDILEIVVAVEKKYGIKVEGSEEGKMIFKNIGTLSDFVQNKARL